MRSIFAIVLICFSLVTPVHAKEAKAKTTDHADEGQSQQQGTESSPIVVQIEGAQTSAQKAAEDKRREDAEAAVKRRELALTFFIFLATAIEAAATCVMVSIYRKQSKLMAENLVETKKATENVGKQLSFQMEAMRPRLKISTFNNETFKEALAGKWVFVNMGISNTGGMPAYGVVIDTWIEFAIGEPPDSISPTAKYARAAPMNIHTGDPSGFSIPLHRKLTEEEKYQMANAKGAIIFRVRMNYRAFADEAHTDEAFLVRPDAMENIAKYTSAT